MNTKGISRECVKCGRVNREGEPSCKCSDGELTTYVIDDIVSTDPTEFCSRCGKSLGLLEICDCDIVADSGYEEDKYTLMDLYNDLGKAQWIGGGTMCRYTVAAVRAMIRGKM